MKELTVEQKAKRYDEAIERAKEFKEHLLEINEKDYADEMDYVFPELAESAEEKIRKALIRFHKSTIDVDGIKGDDIIAWLEKQDEKTDIANKEYWRGYREGKQEILDKYAELEKQGQKPQGKSALDAAKEENVDNQNCVNPADKSKIKPKFKTGDRVIGIVSGMPYFITEVCDDHYNTESGCIIMFCSQDNFELYEQNPAEWSEEDEITRKALINLVEMYYGGCIDKTEKNRLLNFLKYLRPQSQWKPSDRQMKALKEACDEHWEPDGLDPLYTLWEQLKKLKE